MNSWYLVKQNLLNPKTPDLAGLGPNVYLIFIVRQSDSPFKIEGRAQEKKQNINLLFRYIRHRPNKSPQKAKSKTQNRRQVSVSICCQRGGKVFNLDSSPIKKLYTRCYFYLEHLWKTEHKFYLLTKQNCFFFFQHHGCNQRESSCFIPVMGLLVPCLHLLVIYVSFSCTQCRLASSKYVTVTIDTIKLKMSIYQNIQFVCYILFFLTLLILHIFLLLKLIFRFRIYVSCKLVCTK